MRVTVLILLLALAAPALAEETIEWPGFGDSVNAIKQAQIINPGGSTEPVEGQDGVAAAGAVKRYREAAPAEQGTSGSLSETTYSVMSIGGGQ